VASQLHIYWLEGLGNYMRFRFTRFWVFSSFAAMSTVIALAQEAPQQAPATGEPQDQQAPANRGGWRRVTETPPPANQPPTNAPEAPSTTARVTEDDPAAPLPANAGYQPADAYGQSQSAPRGSYQQPGYQPNSQQPGYPPNSGYQPLPQVPAQVNIRPGTYLTVRIDQPLSSDHNHAGDAFSATLVKPLVVDGVIVAQTGQTLGGRVVEAQKAGRVEGVSRLKVELIDMTLVDGSQLPLKTQFVAYNGSTSVGRDTVAVGGTTALGAAVGGAAAGGVGAGIGAGAGAVVGLIGVLTTRGHQTVIYPESVLTFRIENPIPISTTRSPEAFRFVQPQDYQRSANLQQRYQAAAQPRAVSPYAYGYGYANPYWYPYYPYYWGPGLSFYYGPGFYGGFGGFYGGGFYRGGGFGRGGGGFGRGHR
jgi:hypothetical protein